MQGKEFEGVADALRDGDLDAANLDPPERLLLEFVGTISKAAYRVTDEQVQGLRDVGWTDEQIAEAAYVAEGPSGSHFRAVVDANDVWIGFGETFSGRCDPALAPQPHAACDYFTEEFAAAR